MLETILWIAAGLLFLYVVREYLVEVIKFLCDNLLGKILQALRDWIEAGRKALADEQKDLGKRIETKRLLGSLFLFVLAVAFAAANYALILFGLELLLPVEQKIGFIGVSAASLASIVVILVEMTLGFLLLETLGVTDLFEWHNWPRRNRVVMFCVLITVLATIIGVEVGIALYRVSEVIGSELGQQGFAGFVSKLPYWVTVLLAAGVPVATAISAYSLRDVLLLLGWTFLSILRLLAEVLGLVFSIVYELITHIDDFFSTLIRVLTYVVEVVAAFVVLILVKAKAIPAAALLAFFLVIQACRIGGDKAPAPKSKIVVAIIDNSGSFDPYLRRAVAACKRYIDELSLGDGFGAFLIERESLGGTRPPFIPLMWLSQRSETHITPRRMVHQAAAARDSLKKSLETILALKRAERTDLNGAMARAATLLSSFDSTRYAKHLLVFSDMKDNVGKEMLGANLAGVEVRLLFVDVVDEPTRRNCNHWVQTLHTLGACNISVFNPDQSESQISFALPSR
ncbi:MAG: hypothetical protein ONB30_03580 [candidate division KSB1 bacterium]|nr:hypothetical protein [candidate division KSB1 bacterium]